MDLDWIRTTNLFKIQNPDQIWTQLMEKKCGIFVVKRAHVSKFLTLFGLGHCIWKKFWTVFGLGLSYKK